MSGAIEKRLLMKIVFFAFVTISGLLCLLYYSKYSTSGNPDQFMLAMGAALIGVGLSGIIVSILEKSLTTDAFAYISMIEDERLTSIETDALNYFRRNWHLYHRTKHKNDFKWVYSRIDFSSKIPGQLIGSLKHKETDCVFVVKGFVRREKLVLHHTSESKDLMSPSISIFPNCKDYLEFHAGILQHADYHDKERISPMLLSKKPLLKGIEDGSFIRNENKNYENLENLWKNSFNVEGIEMKEVSTVS